jgi:hypothetical protein
MDLVGCSECASRFYAPGTAPAGRLCPRCGGDLSLAAHGISSIPLDARWLDPRDLQPAMSTTVELRRKRARGGRSEQRIVEDLGDYFAVKANGSSVRVSVNRGAAAEAPLRVAAVLDGVDVDWEDHFYLPTPDSELPDGDLPLGPVRARGHLHLVRADGEAPRSGRDD